MRTCIHCIVYWTNCWIKLNSMRFIHSHKLTLHMSYFHILILFLSFFIVYLHFHFKIDIVLMMIINWLFSFLFFFISNLFLFFFLFLFFYLVYKILYMPYTTAQCARPAVTNPVAGTCVKKEGVMLQCADLLLDHHRARSVSLLLLLL